MAKKKTQQFPPVLFVNYEEDGEFFNADADPGKREDGEYVAIYELKQIKRMKVTKELR